jgi:hypothetical protein
MNNITTYLISASLIFLVIRQIRGHPLDARSLATPVLAVGAAAVMFLHAVPAQQLHGPLPMHHLTIVGCAASAERRPAI